jgi:hypothetical protein
MAGFCGQSHGVCVHGARTDMRRSPRVHRDMMRDCNMAGRADSKVSRSDSFVEHLKFKRWLEGGASMSVHGGYSPSLGYMQ